MCQNLLFCFVDVKFSIVVGLAYPLQLCFTVQMHHVQLKGMHNSYALPNVLASISHKDLNYAHTAIEHSLEHGVRGIELDVFFRPDGVEYFVYHDKNVAGTQCVRLSDCLHAVRRFTDAHPTHHWIHHLVEIKEWLSGWTQAKVVAVIEQEYIDAYGLNGMVTVANVRKHHVSLKHAVNTDGWPTLGQTRGKQLLTIQFAEGDEEATQTDRDRLGQIYNSTTVAFAFARTRYSRNESWAVVQQVDREVVQSDPAFISQLLNESIIARARSDADLDQFQFKLVVIESGCHIVSTDFPYPMPDTDFFVELPGGEPSRCNPKTAPAGCTPADIETGITSFAVGLEEVKSEWCCSDPTFYWGVIILNFILFALFVLIAFTYLVCCQHRHGSPPGTSAVMWLLVYVSFSFVLQILLTRAVTDVIILRFQVVPNDLLNMFVTVSRSLVLSVILTIMLNIFFPGSFNIIGYPSDEAYDGLADSVWRRFGVVQFTIGTPLLYVIGLIISWTGMYSQSFGLGIWDGEKGYIYVAWLQSISSIVALLTTMSYFAIVRKSRENVAGAGAGTSSLSWSCSRSSRYNLCVVWCFVSVICLQEPVMLLLSVFEKVGALVPIRSMLLAMPGTRVVAWHSLLGCCVTFVTLNLTLFRWCRSRSHGKVVESDYGSLHVSSGAPS
jgi:glycerophosphoryl diester phosphodiesterase